MCSKPIPAARLKAKPNATVCVSCLEASGDVPLVRRFDEHVGDEVVSTTFTHDQYVERAISRQNHVVPSNAAFEQAVGDDSFLVRERGAGVSAEPLSTAFEEEVIERIDRARKNANNRRIHEPEVLKALGATA